MKHTKKQKETTRAVSKKIAGDYMKTLVDIVTVARESFLILDAKLRVLIGNPTFYKVFQVTPKQTLNKFVYQLGNGQWNIPTLKKLLEEVLPKKKIVTNYEVNHTFQTIGEKSMLLNARQIDSMQLIILAIEDITLRRGLEKKLHTYTELLENKVSSRTVELTERVKELESLNKTMVGRELRMVELKKEIEVLKKRNKKI